MNIDPGLINTPKWPVFYEDNHLLVVYKPSGLLIQGDRTGDTCLLELARQYIKVRYEKPGNVFLGMVHRLDRPVAGVVVFARTSKAAARLNEQFRTSGPEKQYLAVVQGIVPDSAGAFIDHLERRGATSRILASPSSTSRQARLRYRRLDILSTPGAQKSLVEIDLETGRHHQIRVQFAHRGFPVLGDLRYGAAAPLPQKQLVLFARKLSFDHPTQKQRMTFCAPLPLGWPWPATPENLDAPVWDWKALQA
ncbi:MAG: RNA pseudouridine synthase [Desulfobacterales bacterium]|nr:RNA pseudouridine synthase [Desulfobacterales bacterium]